MLEDAQLWLWWDGMIHGMSSQVVFIIICCFQLTQLTPIDSELQHIET